MGFRYYPDGVALFTSFGDQTLMKYDGRSLTLRYKALDMEAIHACSLVGFDCLHEKVLSGADINAVSEVRSALHKKTKIKAYLSYYYVYDSARTQRITYML